MAIASGTIFESRASATTGNVNGAGFNPANANFPTDLATDTNTANTASPVVSSTTYNFVAGDVGSYVYVKSGTHWQFGYYPIASVSGGKATLNAAIGAVVISIGSQGIVTYNTVAGCTSDNTATLTAGTYGVDYSQQDTAVINAVTDFAAVGASTTLTSLTAGFTPVMVGNLYHQTTTGTGAFGLTNWFEILSYTNATTVTLDRTPNNGTASAACTGYVGGAGRLNGLEDSFNAMLPGSAFVWVKNGSYTFSGSVSTANNNATVTTPTFYIGYNTKRGDVCVGSNRPAINAGANSLQYGATQLFNNLSITGTGANVWLPNTSGGIQNCKVTNTSSTAGRSAFSENAGSIKVANCEFVSQNGIAATTTQGPSLFAGNYIHDSVTGASGVGTYVMNLFEACSTAAITSTTAASSNMWISNTIYGREAQMGVGINLTVANANLRSAVNNIIYGCTTGINVNTGSADSNFSLNNDFFNNGTDVTNWTKGATDVAVNPGFLGASQITGTTASGSGSVLTDTNANFSAVTDGVDYVRVLSGTGATVACFLITSHTTTTLTCNNTVGTNATADRVYFVTTGHNFQVGSALAGLGFSSFANSGSETTSYPYIGATVPQSSSGSGGTPVLQSAIIQGLGAV